MIYDLLYILVINYILCYCTVLGSIFCAPCTLLTNSPTEVARFLEVVLASFDLTRKFAVFVPYKKNNINDDDWELLVIFIKTKEMYITNSRLSPLTLLYLSDFKR